MCQLVLWKCLPCMHLHYGRYAQTEMGKVHCMVSDLVPSKVTQEWSFVLFLKREVCEGMQCNPHQ